MPASILNRPNRVPAWDNAPGHDHTYRMRVHPYCPRCKSPVLGQYVYVEEPGRTDYYHVDCYQGELCQRCLRHGDLEPLTPEHVHEAHDA